MSASAGRHLNVIFLPTSRCDAACTYCFSAASGHSMEPETVEMVAERLAQHVVAAGLGQVTIYWQGGEVMVLGHQWVRDGYGTLQRHLESAGATVVHRLQSNLLRLDAEWLAVIHELFEGRVSTSYDYPNLHRLTAGGDAATYTEVWLEKVSMARSAGIRCGIICIPSAATVRAGAEEVCRFFFDRVGSHGFQVNLPFPSRAWESRQGGAIELAGMGELGDFLCDLYDRWDGFYAAQGKQVQPLTRLKGYLAGGSRRLPWVWGRDCARDFVCVGPRGEVGLCDCWVLTYPELSFGNLREEPLATLLEAPWRQRVSRRLEGLVAGECGTCADLESCFGGCPIRAFTSGGDIDARDPYCGVYRQLFRHIEGTLSRGRTEEVRA